MLAGTFVIAAVSKARAVRSLGTTIVSLGTPSWLARPTAIAVVAGEGAAAVGLAVVPTAWWPRLLVVVLAAGFAGAGAVALLGHRRISCSCFGSLSGARLGWRQITLLPLWWGLAGLAQGWAPAWNVTVGVLGLDVVVIGLLARALITQRRLWRAVRGSRLAAAGFETRGPVQLLRESP